MSKQSNRRSRAASRRRRSRVTSPSHGQCGPVTITRADGTTEVQPALSRKELEKVVPSPRRHSKR